MRDDAAYAVIGSQWVPIANSGDITQDLTDMSVDSLSVTGARRVLTPSDPSRSRSWTVSVDGALPWGADSLGAMEWLSLTKTPFGWVPPLARLGNGLQQEWQSTGLALAIVNGIPGVAPVDMKTRAWTGFALVRPGKEYTFSLNVDTGFTAEIAVYFTVNGRSVRAGTLTKEQDGRKYGTFTAPAGATAARITVASFPVLANAPAISEGPNLRPYTAPKGCEKAVLSLGAFKHSTGLGRPYKVSFDAKVMEVS